MAAYVLNMATVGSKLHWKIIWNVFFTS